MWRPVVYSVRRVEKAERASRVVGKNNKAADAGSLIVICSLCAPIASKPGLLRSGLAAALEGTAHIVQSALVFAIDRLERQLQRLAR